MEGMALVVLVLVALAVAYKLGLFAPVVALTDVANREAAVYNREHKVKVARRYLASDNTFGDEEVAKINSNIEAIDTLKFD